MTRAIVLLSGGIDSAVALAWAHDNFTEIQALSFNYHLRPFRERLAVYRLLQKFLAPLFEPSIPFIKEATDVSAQNTAPEGYISNRNMIWYALACYYAESYGCDALVGGHTTEDAEAFSDASQSFMERLQDLANEALLLRKIRIVQPLISLNKFEVLRKAVEWDVPLQHTWSCYSDSMRPCGTCASCTERADAFQKLGIPDPLLAF